MKTCTKCATEKPLEDFHRAKRYRMGVKSHCKECVKAYQLSNRDSIQRSQQEWRKANPDYSRNYYHDHAYQHGEYATKYYAENRESIATYATAYSAAKPHMGWEAGYRHRARAFGFTPVLESFTKADVIGMYGDQCWHCESAPFEQLDHFPVPVSRGGHHVLENVKPSCAACNRRSWSWCK